jgi:hypothetical protein
MFIPLTEWSPDSDPTEGGLIVDIENMIPSLKGYKSVPAPANTGLPALAAACRGAGVVTILDGSSVLFAGTQTKLYLAGATAWSDVSIAGDYTGSATSKWRFAQQGNVTLAVNKVDESQFYLHGTSTDFADTPEMPKALVVEAVGQFILIGNYNDGTDTVDGWACSAIGDYDEWTASVDTQCVYGRLVDTPGPITALRRLGDYAIFYKAQSMYLARYVGAPSVWEFSLISDVIGAVSQEAVAKIGTVHYFLGDEDFYAYDTASVQPIGKGIREWFNSDINNEYRNTVVSSHDRKNGIVYWFYPSGTSTSLNAFVAYHYRTNRWGKGLLDVQAAAEFVQGGLSYNDLDVAYGTYAGIPEKTYDNLQVSPGTPIPAIFNTSNRLQTLTGISASSSLTTNDFGMEPQKMIIRRVRPRYMESCASSGATLTNYYRECLGESLIEDFTTSQSNSRFDFLRTARWHRGKFNWTGNVELTGIDVDAKPEGKE